MALFNLAEAPGWAGELLEQARVAHLGFNDDAGQPRVLPVVFALAGDRIWSSVDEKPKQPSTQELARVRFLRRDPRAALTVDRYSDDWDRLAWVQVLGTVEVFPTDEAPEALAALGAKYHQYRASPPPGPMLALRPDRCLFWRSARE